MIAGDTPLAGSANDRVLSERCRGGLRTPGTMLACPVRTDRSFIA